MLDPHLQNSFHDIGFIINSVRGGSYFGIFILSVFTSYFVPIPEAVLMAVFGVAAKAANLEISSILLFAVLGILVGDNILYRLSFFGNKYVEHFNRKMRKHKLIKYEHLVLDNIGKTIYFLRFVTGVRFFGPVIAGTLGVRWRKFFLHNAVASTIHTVFFILLGYFWQKKVITLVSEVEIAKSVLFFSSTLIVGLLIGIAGKGKREIPET